MNESPLYLAALQHGCTIRQAEVIDAYTRSEKLADAAQLLGITESTAKNHMTAIRQRLDVPHAAAAVRKLLEKRPH